MSLVYIIIPLQSEEDGHRETSPSKLVAGLGLEPRHLDSEPRAPVRYRVAEQSIRAVSFTGTAAIMGALSLGNKPNAGCRTRQV